MTEFTNANTAPAWLVLIPTEFERNLIADKLRIPNSTIEICGFGPIVPAARTVQLIHDHQPDSVLLIGIAGSYDRMLPAGSAFSFTEVACYGVGVGSGDSFQTAMEMGWAQWPNDTKECEIADMIPLEPVKNIAAQLLTVCSAAENETDVRDRLKKYPSAIAEDMEGFAVAAACRLRQVPISIVRGLSNRAGDRDKSNWKIEAALSAAVKICNERIGEESRLEK